MKLFQTDLAFVRIAAALAVATCSPSQVLAWGAEGHRLVAEESLQLLTPAAHTEVDRLLALEPGATLASISTWADETSSRETAPWHYVNFPPDSDCVYEAPRDCPDGKCVVAAIEQQQAVLASKTSDAQRLVALKYIVHFVGDIHQPLHAGDAEDRGGNAYQVRFDGHGTNLHAVWDSGLIRTWPGGPDALSAAVAAKLGTDAGTSTPAQWAKESCQIVKIPGFYPRSRVLGDKYARQVDPIVVQRLAAAASRLAQVLNASLGARD